MRGRKTTVEERFWRNVDKRGPDECWNWTASTSGGYGRVVIGTNPIIKTGAHRISYLIHYGILQSDLDVMHDCDNPSCCNPRHLKMGTTADNMTDKANKGRCNPPMGIHAPRAKLNPDLVREIRKLRGTDTYRNIGRKFGVSGTAVRDIYVGRFWKAVE